MSTMSLSSIPSIEEYTHEPFFECISVSVLTSCTLDGKLYLNKLMCCRYFIFTSFWAYKIYYVYGFMLLVFLILIVVTVCVTIVCTYFLLNAEDYRWFVALLFYPALLVDHHCCRKWSRLIELALLSIVIVICCVFLYDCQLHPERTVIDAVVTSLL